MQAPLLFGVDPDETWRYVPAVVAAAGPFCQYPAPFQQPLNDRRALSMSSALEILLVVLVVALFFGAGISS